MAIEKTNLGTKFILAVETGVTAGGASAYSQRSIAHVHPSLSDEDALDIGTAVAALQSYPLGTVTRQDTAVLTRA